MKCLLVDLEGVVLGSKRESYRPWLRSLGADPSEVNKVYQKEAADLYKGAISCSKAVRKINDSLGINIPTREFFKHRTDYSFVNQEVINLVKRMKKRGVRVYLLSDISECSWMLVRKKYPFLRIFNQRVLSFNTGFTKEEPEYYDYLGDRLNCKKSEMLLIDDKLENILTAKKMGLAVVHFRYNTDLTKLF